MSAILFRLGSSLRETGQALQKLGAQLQGQFGYREQCTCFWKHLTRLTCVLGGVDGRESHAHPEPVRASP